VTTTLLLPWLPIVLAVGVGSRLLDRVRGGVVGLIGALFWVLLVQSTLGAGMFFQGRMVAALTIGALAIVAVGAWSGYAARQEAAARERERAVQLTPREPTASGLPPVADVLRRFDDWLEVNRHQADPWPEFGEFLRAALHDLCGATHVRPYRVLSQGDVLIPLRAFEPGDNPDLVSARRGIVGHVVTSGVSFVAGDAAHGRLIDELAGESEEDIAWCFAITQGGRRIGLVRVGQLTAAGQRDTRRLETAATVVCQFWAMLTEVCRSRAAETLDPASNLLTRESFLAEADRALAAADAQSEPAAVAVIALEGIRTLSDRGDWEIADALIAAAARLLRERVRGDDRLGRFDESRFVLLLRRVDSALATLIVNQLVSRLDELCRQEVARIYGDDPLGTLTVRCGVSGTGMERPALATLVARAVAQCHQARRTVVPVSSDLEESTEPAAVAVSTSAAGEAGVQS